MTIGKKVAAWFLAITVTVVASDPQRFGKPVWLSDDRVAVLRGTENNIMAAKTTNWTGNDSTDWDTAGNWTNGVPNIDGSKDTIHVLSGAVNDMLLNIDHLTENTNVGKDLTLFQVDKGCTINIGASAAPLKITADTFNIFGGGVIYLTAQTGGSGSALVDTLQMDSPDTKLILRYIHGPTDAYYMAGLIEIPQLQGQVSPGEYSIYQLPSILFPSAISTVEIIGTFGGKDIKKYHGTAGNLILGTAWVNGGFQVVHNHGASIRLEGNAAARFGGVGTAHQEYFQTNGELILKTRDNSSFVDNTLNIMGGILDTTDGWSASQGGNPTVKLWSTGVWLRTKASEDITTLVEIGNQ